MPERKLGQVKWQCFLIQLPVVASQELLEACSVALAPGIATLSRTDSLRQLARSVADLAVLGTQRDKIDSLVIAELSDISGSIASASSMVSRDRGALISYQRRLDSIAQHAPIVVYAIDVQNRKKGDLLYVSEAIERITGYTRDEATVSGWLGHAIHPEDYDRCLALFGDLQLGKVITAEYRLRHKLGHYIWVSDTLAVEASASSDRTEAVGVVIDITERKAASEQLQQADKMVSLGRMISGTAHELNQPLNFIKMAASNLRERARRGQVDADRLIAKLDSILSHVTRASGIILQMRIFGRIPREAPFPIEVKAAIEQVLAMVAPQLELDGTRVETSGCAPGIMVRALPVLLEQVLLNLVLNANDAIRVRRKTGDARDGLIRICVSKRDALAIVTVEDNGTGLPADILPMIFEPFFTTKPPKEGTGLRDPIALPSGEIKVTASIGLVKMTGTKTESLDLLRYADIALYAAKENGRNRVELCAQQMLEKVERQSCCQRQARARQPGASYWETPVQPAPHSSQ